MMLEDGRVRRLLLSEFAAIGQVPWSVGHGISCQRTDEEVRAAKVTMGNTWDGGLTKRTMGVAADFAQYLVNKRSDELLEFRLSHHCTAGLDRTPCPIA